MDGCCWVRAPNRLELNGRLALYSCIFSVDYNQSLQVGFDQDIHMSGGGQKTTSIVTTGGGRKWVCKKRVEENGAFWLAHIPLPVSVL